LKLSCADEDGNQAAVEISLDKQPAEKKDQAQRTIRKHLTKLGNTPFECSELQIEMRDVYFLPVSHLNAARRDLVQRLLDVRQANRPRPAGGVKKNAVPYPEKRLTYLGNVLNAKAEAFYKRHGVEQIEPAAETGLDLSGRMVMTTKYCLRQELGLCPGRHSKIPAESLVLEDLDGRRYALRFRCGDCGMEIFLV